MNKYLYLSLIVVSCSVFAKAQTGKDSVLNLITKEVCEEIDKKDFMGMSTEEIQTELGLTIIPSITSRIDVLKKYYPVKSISEDNIDMVAENVGSKLVLNCPVFMKLITSNPSILDIDDEENEIKQPLVTGTLQKIVPGDFTYLQVKDANGKVEKIWWMEYFEGADKLTETLLNKPVKISFNVKETYNAQLKEYVSVKVATKLQLIQ